MIQRFASLVLVAALVCTICGTSAFARATDDSDTPGKPLATVPALPKPEASQDERLRASVAKLVADTKAGKRTAFAPAQMHPSRGNNLSKNKKIAIGVTIAAVVVLALVVNHARNHLFDDFRLGNVLH